MDQQIRRAIEEVRNTPDPTREQTARFYANLTAIAENKLARRLTASEKESLKGMDRSLSLYEAMTELVESYTTKELLEFLAERGADGPLGLLKHLASSRRNVRQDWSNLLTRIGCKEASLLRKFDFEQSIDQFSSWLKGLLLDEPPPPKIKALYFGLFESNADWRLCVSGAETYDVEDSNWASANDWWPEGRYAPVAFSETARGLREVSDKAWVFGQAIAMLLIRGFFQQHRAEVKSLLGNRRLFIASGFVDGDLYGIKTPFSPTA